MEIAATILNGILLGGLYCLFATGLSLIFGVMRLVNIAHGDLIVFASYAALVATTSLGLNPFVSILIVIPVMSALGYALQRAVLNKTIGSDILPPLLVTFGLSIVIQNSLLEGFTADSRRILAGGIEVNSFEIIPGLAVGIFPLVVFLAAIIVTAALQYLFYKIPLGRMFRAVSDDYKTAELMGLNTRHIFSLAMAVCFAVIALAGLFMAIKTSFDPTAGPIRLLFAFEAVIIGGLGSLWGTLIGGLVLGLGQAIGAYIHPGLQVLAGHIVFLVILFVRPEGLFPRIRE